jgi:hypothetical protein
MPGLVRWVALVEVAADERCVTPSVEVGRGGTQGRRWLCGLLDETDDAILCVDVDDPVLLGEFAVADVVDRDGARVVRALEMLTNSLNGG